MLVTIKVNLFLWPFTITWIECVCFCLHVWAFTAPYGFDASMTWCHIWGAFIGCPLEQRTIRYHSYIFILFHSTYCLRWRCEWYFNIRKLCGSPKCVQSTKQSRHKCYSFIRHLYMAMSMRHTHIKVTVRCRKKLVARKIGLQKRLAQKQTTLQTSTSCLYSISQFYWSIRPFHDGRWRFGKYPIIVNIKCDYFYL